MQIGAMHMRAHPSKISRVYAFASVAKIENIDFFYFSPGKVDFAARTIDGFYYENGEWKDKVFPFPKVVINMFRANTRKQEYIYDRLEKEVHFTEYPIGDKEDIYEILKYTSFKKYLPITKTARDSLSVKKFLDVHKKIVLKPMRGCQGVGVLIIEKNTKGYNIYEGSVGINVVNLEGYLKNIDLKNHIMQKFIHSETMQGLPVDFRIHTQKDGNGEYILSTIFPRIANVKNKVTNYSQGGYTVDINNYLKNEFGDNWKAINNLMKIFAIQISEFINDYYSDKLNELGVDVGIDKDMNLYLYEINWRPGVPIIFKGELDHAKNLIKYCRYKSKSL